MHNVLPFKPAKTEAPQIETPSLNSVLMWENLQALWMSGTINTDALWLGLQICAKMIESNSTTVATTHRTAAKTYTTARGRVCGGRVCGFAPEFTIALQQLHFEAKVYSCLTPDFMESEGFRGYHFTRDVSIPSPAFGYQTPIHFAVIPQEMEIMSSGMNDMIDALVIQKGIEQVLMRTQG